MTIILFYDNIYLQIIQTAKHKVNKEEKKMESKLLKSYKGYTIEKSYELDFNGKIDKDTIILANENMVYPLELTKKSYCAFL